MNDKVFNLQILAALTEYANELIAAGRVTVEESGQYTAANLANGKNDMGEYLHIDMKDADERRTIQVDGFSCMVAPCNIFNVIYKFEKICRVNDKSKTRYTFGDGQNDIIKERAMFVDGKGNVKTRTKALRRQTEHTATDKCGAVYYQVASGGVWYYVQGNIKPERVEEQLTLEFMRNAIKGCGESLYLPIYSALLAELEVKEQGKEVEPTEKVKVVRAETKELATEVKTSITPHSFAQERTERRSRTTYRIYENDGSQRIFLRQANIMMMKKISGFSIKNRHEKAKFGKFSSRNVVHVFPLPPPFRAIPNVK